MIKKTVLCMLCVLILITASAAAFADSTPAPQENEATAEDMPSGEIPQGEMPAGEMPMPGGSGGRQQGNFDGQPPQRPEGSVPHTPYSANANQQSTEDAGVSPAPAAENSEQAFGDGNTMMGNPFESEASANETTSSSITEFFKTYSTPLFSLVLLAAAFVFVIFYKRKKY